MKRSLFIIIGSFFVLGVKAQILPIYTDLYIQPAPIEDYKNFEQYHLKDLIIYNGIKKEALYLFVVDSETGNRVFELDERDVKARRFKIQVFGNEETQENKVICVSLEGDYSWGTHVLLVEGKKVYDAGYLSYGVDNFNFASIGLYAQFEDHSDWLLMFFREDARIINYATEDIINGNDIEFKVSKKGITRLK